MRYVGLIAAAAALILVAQAIGGTSRVATSTASCQRAGRTLAAATRAASPTTYDDFIGDSGSAPDFCASEFVTNDDETLTIGIHAHNRSGFTPGDNYRIFLDTDQNPSTGGGEIGAEYEITFDGSGAKLNHWSGASFDPVSTSPLPIQWANGYGPILAVRRVDLGSPSGFNFALVSANGQDGDRAPDAGTWSYTLTPLELDVKSLSHGTARAGRPFTARMLVMRSDFDVVLREGTIGCAANLAGQPLRGTGTFTHGRIACTWHLPKNARGKQLSGSVAITFQDVDADHRFSVRVR